jgi:TonB family protein
MKMMKKNRSPRYLRWLYLLVLPFVAILVFAVSCQNGKSKTEPMQKKTDTTINELASDDSKIYNEVDEMPVFGKDENSLVDYLISAVVYPKDAKEKGIQGKVFVSFTVTNNGKVLDAKVVEPVNPLLDAEALRVIAGMPDWTPGIKDGKNVNVSMTIPINFKLK